MRRFLFCVLCIVFAICTHAQDHEYPAYFLTAPRLNLREAPSRYSKKIAELPNEVQVKVLDIDSGGWARLVYKGDTAYAFAQYLDYVRPTFVQAEPDESSRIIKLAWIISELILISCIIWILIRLYRIIFIK